MLLALIKMKKMMQTLNTNSKPGMKASIISHNAMTTLIITSMSQKLKNEVELNEV